MGMFNMLRADLTCPVKRQIGKDTEIQFKWQKREARALSVYRLGDELEDLEEEYDNHWIRTDYVCEVCSKKTKGYRGEPYISTDDQQRHYVFIEVKKSKIEKILSEEDFAKQGITNFMVDW